MYESLAIGMALVLVANGKMAELVATFMPHVSLNMCHLVLQRFHVLRLRN
jgi:hypothetical protein